MGFCPICGNWVDEGDICGHCGSSGGYDDSNDNSYNSEDKSDKNISRYEYFYRQGKACSIKGDSATAIKFYNESLKETSQIREICDMLSIIADEYEAMGDYDCAENYWNRCCAVEGYGRNLSLYRDIAGKGDFLYRRERYEDAIIAYEDALNSLEDIEIDLLKLKYYARIIHFIIASYKLLGKNNPEKKYHNLLKQAINRHINASINNDETIAHYISQTAWEIYESDTMIDEALILIDAAIELHPHANHYSRKAIFIKLKLKTKVILNSIELQDLDLINETLKILPDDCDNGPYLTVKGDICNQLGDPVKARICYSLAVKDYEKVDNVERQLKKLTNGTFINITGIHYYHHFEPFKEGIIVDLIKEENNQYDRDAIRVEIDGETVGYVANNKYTLIKQVKSATDIKNTQSTQAEVQFILFNEWVIAKLL